MRQAPVQKVAKHPLALLARMNEKYALEGLKTACAL